MRTSSALTVPDTDEVELLTMSIRHVCNMRTSQKYTLVCTDTCMHNFGLKDSVTVDLQNYCPQGGRYPRYQE